MSDEIALFDQFSVLRREASAMYAVWEPLKRSVREQCLDIYEQANRIQAAVMAIKRGKEDELGSFAKLGEDVSAVFRELSSFELQWAKMEREVIAVIQTLSWAINPS